MRERVDSDSGWLTPTARLLPTLVMLPSDSHQGPHLTVLFLSIAPTTPHISQLTSPAQDSRLQCVHQIHWTICLGSQILMVDMQQRTSLGIFIEVTQFETEYYI